MKYIERTDYLNKLIRLIKTPDIKIITGIRRAGKSELVRAYIDWIKNNESNANIIYIDFADLKYDNLKNYKSLNNYCEKNYVQDKLNILVIDEIQLCKKFELTINSLYNSHRFDIYITGSKAFLLSSDLSTLFTGRYIEIQVFPFSFAEYCRYYDYQRRTPDVLDSYITNGGLAGSYVYKDKEDQNTYVKDVYNTVIKRDLVEKYSIKVTSSR